jgi:hypothetical protein
MCVKIFELDAKLVRLRIEVKNLGKSLAELATPPCIGKGITKMPSS